MFLLNNFTLYSCGENVIFILNIIKDGQLGLGDNIKRNMPTLVPNFQNIIKIYASGHHSFLITNKTEIYSFGVNGVI